jgi:hypothetical protein
MRRYIHGGQEAAWRHMERVKHLVAIESTVHKCIEDTLQEAERGPSTRRTSTSRLSAVHCTKPASPRRSSIAINASDLVVGHLTNVLAPLGALSRPSSVPLGRKPAGETVSLGFLRGEVPVELWVEQTNRRMNALLSTRQQLGLASALTANGSAL